MHKRIISMLLLIMMLACMPSAQAAGAPEIVTQPEPQIVIEGGSCAFTASASGDTGITWRLQSPDGSEDFPFTDAPTHFKGLKVSGKNSDKLTLSDIPGGMDGWLVYCRYANKAGKTDTGMVPLFVTDRNGSRINGNPAAPAATPAPQIDDSSTLTFADGEKILRTYGCYIQFVDGAGNAQGEKMTELNFGEAYYNSLTRKTITNGDVDVRITADIPKGQKAAYWVINGAKYTFNTEVKSFTLRELTYGMTIEAVFSDSGATQTLPTMEEIQQQRTDEILLVETQSARMAHVDANGKSAGGYFTEFDFTEDFTNRATNQTEQGGRVTVKVSAIIPEGKVVTFWRFNGARINFNSDVTSFVVENLSESMVYRPVFYTKTTPVPEYTINCTNCTFSGGGYTNAKSGTVPYGTKITITPEGNSYLGWWSGSYSTGEVNKKAITWTVNSNCSFEWHIVVN